MIAVSPLSETADPKPSPTELSAGKSVACNVHAFPSKVYTDADDPVQRAQFGAPMMAVVPSMATG